MIGINTLTCLNEQGKRENIEDTVYPPYGTATVSDRLFLVCDGIGGESKGEEASRIATESFSGYFNDHPFSDKNDATQYLKAAQLCVIEQMQDYIAHHPEAARMSTTLTLVYIFEDKILAAWCGDSRIYHFRDAKVLWRSTDHSMVSMLEQKGEISEKEAESHPQKNLILRSISANGSPADIDIHWLTDIQTDDYLLLCTDGVLEQMDENRFQSVLLSGADDKRSLFLKYCEGKTSDNFSLYLLKLKTDTPTITSLKKKNKGLTLIVAILSLLIVALILYFLANNKRVQKHETKINAPVQSKPDTVTHHESTPVIPAVPKSK